MKYELAKQLKDAGFPQEGEIRNFIAPDNNILGINHNGEDAKASCYIPTLSELIEACGDKEFYLAHDYNIEGKLDIWRCRIDDTENCVMDCCGTEAEGSTPEEAVAKLWLELNR